MSQTAFPHHDETHASLTGYCIHIFVQVLNDWNFRPCEKNVKLLLLATVCKADQENVKKPKMTEWPQRAL